MDPPETQLAEATRRTGTQFLHFYRVLLKGESPEEHITQTAQEAVATVFELAEALRTIGPKLSEHPLTEPPTGVPYFGMRHEAEILAQGTELAARKMMKLGASVPSMEESENLLPLGPMRDSLKEIGRRLIAVASLLDELGEAPHSTAIERAHLGRLEARLASKLDDLGTQLMAVREMMEVAIVELTISRTKPDPSKGKPPAPG